jgi:hypothetical protein
MVLCVSGSISTLAMAGVGTQLLWSSATPGPAAPYAAASLGIFVLAFVASTVVIARLIGVRTPSQWVRAFFVVGAPIAILAGLIALTPRGL